MYSVLIIDEDPWELINTVNAFQWEKFGFFILKKTTSPKDALEICKRDKPDVLIANLQTSGFSAFDLIDSIKNEDSGPKCIILSSSSDFFYTKKALQRGVFDYLLKPLEQEECDHTLERLFNSLCEKTTNGGRDERKEVFIENRQFRKLVNYISSNLDKELRLNDLSEMFELNTSYCSQLFKKHFSKHFSQYLNCLKIDRACFLLINSTLNLEEISYKSGFNDNSYFMKTFKRIKGVTPNSYRLAQCGCTG